MKDAEFNVKITYYGNDWGYWEIENVEDYRCMFWTDEEFYEYVREGYFYINEEGKYGNEFVEACIEGLFQSDRCPLNLYEKGALYVGVEWIL